MYDEYDGYDGYHSNDDDKINNYDPDENYLVKAPNRKANLWII